MANLPPRWVMSAVATALFGALVVLGCGGSPPAGDAIHPAAGPVTAGHVSASPALRVSVPQGASFGDVTRLLATAASQAGLHGDCVFAWGILELPASARRIELVWDARESPLSGWIIAGGDVEPVIKNPRLRNVGMVEWRDGQLLVSHPSDVGQSPLEIPANGPGPLLLLFGAPPVTPAGSVLAVLRDSMPRAGLISIWEIATLP